MQRIGVALLALSLTGCAGIPLTVPMTNPVPGSPQDGLAIPSVVPSVPPTTPPTAEPAIAAPIIVPTPIAAAPNAPLKPKEIAERSFPSVVNILMEDGAGTTSQGSGFFVADDLVATNFHVIEGMNRGSVKILDKNDIYEIIGVVAHDKVHDLALLKVKGASAKPLEFGTVKDLVVGEEIFAIGNPQGLEGTFTDGLVSSIRQTDGDTYIQISAPISPGSSGGPILNDKGKVVGIATFGYVKGQNLNFAMPVDYLDILLVSPGDPVSLSEISPRPVSLDEPSVIEPSIADDGSNIDEPESVSESMNTFSNSKFEVTFHEDWEVNEGAEPSEDSVLALRHKVAVGICNIYMRKATTDLAGHVASFLDYTGSRLIDHGANKLDGVQAYEVFYERDLGDDSTYCHDVLVVKDGYLITVSAWIGKDYDGYKVAKAAFLDALSTWEWD